MDGGPRWRTPDWFIQSVSGGMGPIGVGKGFREMMTFGLVDRLPAMGLVQVTGCAPMVDAFKRGQRIATPVDNPQTVITTLATGSPGRAYELLFDYVQENGGHFIDASDEESFAATRLLARNDGISVEPATGTAFAGLFKMVQQGIIKADDVVVVNGTGHTLPVETHILGDQWQRTFDLSQRARTPVLPEEGLLSALEHVESDLRSIVVIEDNVDAARLVKRFLQLRGGYDVHVANDGKTGLELVQQLRPDMVITDLMMPDIDGFAVIDTMKADPDLSHIPIVVITAKELTAKERMLLQGQVDTLLQKGSSLDESTVASLLEKLK